MKRLFYVVAFLVVFVLGLTFAARNPQSVTIDYYFGINVDLPLTIVLLISFVTGVVIGFLAALGSRYKRHRRRLRRSRAPTQSGPGTSLAPRGG